MKDNLTVWAMLLASLALATVPIFATESAYHSLAPIHALWLGVATLCAGTSVFWIFRRAGRSQYVADWLALAALTIGSQLIFIEISGYVILLLSLLAAAVYFWRAVKRWIRVASPLAPEPLERPPVRFRYDAQEIVVYPRRRTLAKHAPFMGLLAIFAFGAAVLLRDTTFVIVLSFGALGVLGVVAMTADLVRLVHRWPALVVDVNGITDRASAVVLGFGLIPWHEIADIADSSQVLRRGNLPELVIFPRSYDRLLACQPPLKRPFLRLGSMMSGKTIRVSALLLPMPPRELRLQMLDYVKTHAPPGYLDAEVSVKATKPPLRET